MSPSTGIFLSLAMLYVVAAISGTYIQSANAASKRQSERYYQELWCRDHSGKVEVRLPDRTRVDCITYYHAIEFDFDEKWAEAIGQALHYAIMTDMRGGIVLIGDDNRFITRARNIIDTYNLPLDLWTMPE